MNRRPRNTHNHDNNRRQPVNRPPPVSYLYQRTTVPYQMEQLLSRQLNIIEDLTYDYSRNMRNYNQTVQDLVGCIQTTQNILHSSLLTRSPPPVSWPSDPPPLRSANRHRGTAPIYTAPIHSHTAPIHSHTDPIHTDPNTQHANTLFSYFFYPLNDLGTNPDTPTVMTNDQIEIATQRVIYTNTNTTNININNLNNLNNLNNINNINARVNTHIIDASSCPISLEEFTDGEVLTRINYCRHLFKTQPLMNWFRRDHRCPVCRANLILNPQHQTNTNTNVSIENTNSVVGSITPTTTQRPTTTLRQDTPSPTTTPTGNIMRNLSRNLGRTIGTELMGIMNNLSATNPEINDYIYSFEIPLYDASNNNI